MGKYEKIPSHYSSDLSWVVESCLSVDYKRRPSAAYLLSKQSKIRNMIEVIEWGEKLKVEIMKEEKKEEKENKIEVKK